MTARDQMRRTSRSLLHVLGGELLLRLGTVGVAVLIGRAYGPAVLGMYVATLAVATLVERLADNGLEMSGIAEASRRPEILDRLGAALYINKTIFSFPAIGALAALGWATGLARSHWLPAAILTLRTFLYSYCRLNTGLLKAMDKAPQISRIQFAHSLIICGAIFYAYLGEKSFVFLLLCLLVAQFAEFLLSLWSLRHLGARIGPFTPGLCWHLVRRATPTGLTCTLSTLMLRGDILVLSLMASVSAVGAFAAADTGLVMVYVVAWLFSGVLLADLGRLSSSAGEFDAHFRRCIASILAICVPVAAIAMLLAPFAVRLLYGKNFAAAGLPAAIMCAAVPFIFLNAGFLSRAVARNSASTCLAIYAAGALFSLALNFLLGWRYGGVGIAVSIVLREAAISFAFLRLKNPHSPVEKSTGPLQTSPGFAEFLNA